MVVVDSEGGRRAQTFDWTVTDTVRPPAFTQPLGNQTSNIGDTVSLSDGAAQPDGDQLIYDDNGSLPSGLTIDSLSGVISGTIADDAAASYNVTITATDNTDNDNNTPTDGGAEPDDPVSVSQSFVWTVNTIHDPSLTVPTMQTNAAGDAVSVQVNGNDAPGNTRTYIATNLPDGLSIDAGSGLISGTIQYDAASDTPYQVTATLSDGPYQASQTFSWTVNYVGVPNPGDQGNMVGDAVSLPLPAPGTDASDLALTYSAAGLPPGLAIDGGSGTIGGTISQSADTTYPYYVTVSATDGLHSGSTSFAWDVAAWAPADRTDVEGATVSFAGAAPSSDSLLRYSATGLPPGVSIDAGSGVISGTIMEGDGIAGPYAVSVATAYDGEYSTTQSFTWTVKTAVDVPPTLAAPGDQTSVAGTAVSLALSATDVNGTYPTYSATGLPDGLSLDPDTGVISGAPAEDAIQSAPYAVTVTVDDGYGGTAAQTFDWTVNDSTMSIQGDAISQVTGAGVDTFQVAAFTDPDLNRQAGDYTATINWGDGQTSQGTVSGANGTYTVSGDHVYLHPGSLPLQVTVTDPAGGTATSVETANVAPAPLTLIGNLQDGETTGAATTFTVATFTDANGYAPAASYTATIDWGDGTAPTAGVIDGSDGAFRVTGDHTYAYNGTYTVGVTVTDADGGTATTTSTVTAGDLQAGLDNMLTVAAFTSADPNATANSFTASINWGDSGMMPGPSATVLEEGGQFAVTGRHAYATAGVYTVTVTVKDGAGDTISASEVRQVAPAPVGTSEGNVAAENGYVMDTPLALFALPSGYGSYGQYTATADWGDGTTSGVTLYNNGGILEALGGHGYTGPGQYEVRTLVYNAALQLVAAAVSLVEVDAPAEIVGPVVVPGNSIYRYVVNIPDTPTKQIRAYPPGPLWGRFTITPSHGAAATKVFDGHYYDPTNNDAYTAFFVDVQFANKMGQVTITLPMADWVKGSTKILTLTVEVIQILVKNAPNDFEASGLLKDPDYADKGVFPAPDGSKLNGVKMENPYLQSIVSSGGSPALQWKAGVTLLSWNGQDADHIMVGFHQVATVYADRATFGTAVIKSSLQGRTMLDTNADAVPWFSKSPSTYTPKKPAVVKGAASDIPTDIYYDDSPKFGVLVAYGNKTASRIDASDRFVLSVAAATFGEGNADSHLFQEASALWSICADGTLAKVKVDGGTTLAWTPELAAGVNPPLYGWNLNIAAPVELRTTGPQANDEAADQQWISN